jgi:hypothetical protein
MRRLSLTCSNERLFSMSILRDLERVIDERLRHLFQSRQGEGVEQKRELIEIQRAILEEVADRAQMLPRARRVLTANQITVTIPAPEQERRTALRLIFVEGGALEQDIKAHLQREQIEFPPDLRAAVDLIEQALPDLADRGFHLTLTNREASRQRKPKLKALQFTMPDGATVEIAKQRIHIGRTADVLDDRRRLVRRNDVVIDEQTVSRAHAHIDYDEASGVFRLFDDGSSYGTSVLHRGRLIDVPKAGARGQRLDPGDEIYFGQVRVRVG